MCEKGVFTCQFNQASYVISPLLELLTHKTEQTDGSQKVIFIFFKLGQILLFFLRADRVGIRLGIRVKLGQALH